MFSFLQLINKIIVDFRTAFAALSCPGKIQEIKRIAPHRLHPLTRV